VLKFGRRKLSAEGGWQNLQVKSAQVWTGEAVCRRLFGRAAALCFLVNDTDSKRNGRSDR
jgi:hypothetical protein